MKKIMIITRNMRAGGAERVISQLVAEWCKQDIECSLVLLNKDEIFYDLPENLKLYEIGKVSNNRFADKIMRYKKIRSVIKKENPNVVLSLPEEIGIYVLIAAFGLKNPVVVSERNDPWVMPYKKVTRMLRKFFYPTASGIIFQTKGAASFFKQKIRNKSIILPNPLELKRIPEPFKGKRKKIISGAGRLEPQKNFSLLIEAFAEVYKTHSDYSLVIYGEGTEKNKLEALASRCLPPGVCSFPGVSNDLLNEIRDVSCFVMTSDYEGVPNVLIEAMATGVPVVSTDCAPGGAAELICNGENGYLVPTGDKKKLVKAITMQIEFVSVAEKMAKKAEEVKYKFASEKVSSEWSAYLISKSF